jgi:hypothetical protein
MKQADSTTRYGKLDRPAPAWRGCDVLMGLALDGAGRLPGMLPWPLRASGDGAGRIRPNRAAANARNWTKGMT